MPDSVVSSTSPIIAAPEAPPSTTYYQLWLNTVTGGLHKLEGGEWVPISGGISAEPTTDEVKITHLKVVNGIITELEWEDMGE